MRRTMTPNAAKREGEAQRAASAVRRGDPSAALQQAANTSARVRQMQALSALSRRRDPVQMIKTRAESVALDLLHRDADTLFTDKPDMSGVAGFNDLARGAKRARYVARFANTRDFSYAQLATGTLTGAAQLIALAGVNNREHMYVHNGETVHMYSRGNEKRPHPTLVGGDPDVTCAGELHVTEEEFPPLGGPVTYTVRVTTESGHFRPAAVPNGTVEAVRTAANASVPSGRRVVVGT